MDSATDQLAQNQNRNKTNRELIHNTNEKLSATESKMEALRNITERYDGYGNSIRRVMEQKQWNPGIIGVVADIITVNQKYEVAVRLPLAEVYRTLSRRRCHCQENDLISEDQ